MMKYILFVTLVAFACSQKESKEAKEADAEWKEMDDFHTVMADVYHPLKDSNNLAPVKQNAGDLSAAATKWADAEIPQKVDNKETKELLTQLKDGSQQLATMVKDGASSDELIATKLTILHDTFHTLMEKWYRAGKEDGAEEHHDH